MFRSIDVSGRKGSFDYRGEWVPINSQEKLCFCSHACWIEFANIGTDRETEDVAQDVQEPISPSSQK